MRKIVNFKNACRLCMFLMLLSLTACGGGSGGKYFAKVNDGVMIKPGRLAVIAGERDLVSKNLAKKITERLQGNTSFTVISQDEIKKNLTKYPVGIKTVNDKKANPSYSIDKGEMGKLQKIKDKLKADYLFIIWGKELELHTATSSQGSSSAVVVTVAGKLVHYPKSDVVGYSEFWQARTAKFIDLITLKNNNWQADKLLDECTVNIVDKFIRFAETGKGK